MSPLLILLQFLAIYQSVFADKAHDIAIELDKAINEPESLEVFRNVIAVPILMEDCDKVIRSYGAKDVEKTIENQYDNFHTDHGKAAVKDRSLSDAKFEGEDEKVISFTVAYHNGETFIFKARELEGGKFVIFKVVDCQKHIQ